MLKLKPYLTSLNIFIFSIIIVLIIILILMFAGNSSLTGKNKTSPGSPVRETIEINDKNNTLTVNKNGTVTFRTPDNTVNQQWEADRVARIFRAIREKNIIPEDQRGSAGSGQFMIVYTADGERKIIYVTPDDEIIKDIVIGGGGGDGPAASIPPFSFSSPGNGGGQPNNPNPSSRPGGGPADCPFWVLSWCFYPPSPFPSANPSLPSPSPSPVILNPSPQINPTPVQATPDCSLWGQLVTGKSVISQTLCIKQDNQ